MIQMIQMIQIIQMIQMIQKILLCYYISATFPLVFCYFPATFPQLFYYFPLLVHYFSTTFSLLFLYFSKHRPFGPMFSISRFVCVSVCLSVCSLLRYRLTVFLPPLPEVRCPIFLGIQNPWGKVMERCGLTFEHFCLEVV